MHTPHIPTIAQTDPRLETYEGRRSVWADFVDSGGYVQGYAALRSITDGADGRPRCCCLGVACEMVIELGTGIIEVFDPATAHLSTEKYTYAKDLEAMQRAMERPEHGHEDASAGFLPGPVQEWLGVATKPMVALDQEFLDAWNRELEEHVRAAKDAGLEPVMESTLPIPGLGQGIPRVDDAAFLHSLNDAHVPFSVIAGLIRRERILHAAVGPIKETA